MNEPRLLGGAAMCLAACFAGLRASWAVRARLANAERLRHSLALMQCEIEYGKTPLRELCGRLCDACEAPVSAFYAALAKRLPQTGEALTDAVDAALRDTPALELPPGALAVLRELYHSFGQYGSAEQLALLQGTLRRLDAELSALRAKQAAAVRCRAVLGVSAGLSLFLLVI